MSQFNQAKYQDKSNNQHLSDIEQLLEIESTFVQQVETGLSLALNQAFKLASGKMELKLLVAFSGGPDSTALLSALVKLKQKLGLKLFACHINHQLRADESNYDQTFCEQTAIKFDVPLDALSLSKTNKHLSEEALRTERYSLLALSAKSCNANLIVLGHTLDDQIETILFRLLRGTSPSGLTGIEHARLLNDDLFLLRPMLSIKRADCLAYLQKTKQPFVNDSTNGNTQYTRNFIRHEVITPIKKRFPGFESRVEQLRQLISCDEQFLNELTEKALLTLKAKSKSSFKSKNSHALLINGHAVECWQQDEFQKFPLNIQRRIIAKAMSERNIQVSFEKVNSVLEICHKDGRESLNDCFDVKVDSGFIYWLDKSKESGKGKIELSPVTVNIPGITILPALNCALKIDIWDSSIQKADLTFPSKHSSLAFVDIKQIKAPLTIRTRCPGDQIRPFGMDKLVKLKKFLHTHTSKLASQIDQPTIVIADQQEVIWVPGVGLSNKVRVEKQPSHCLSWLELNQDHDFLC